MVILNLLEQDLGFALNMFMQDINFSLYHWIELPVSCLKDL